MSVSLPGRPGGPQEFDGERYQARFDALAAEGMNIHGEVEFVMGFAPESVLDAGCGTGRVALELARRGVFVVGADRDASMLAVAQARADELAEAMPQVRLSYVLADLVDLDLGGTFDAVVMAGNVPLFTDPGTEARLVASVALHVKAGGVLIAGFQLDRGYGLATYDRDCSRAGLELQARYATWDAQPFEAGGGYAVSVHVRPSAGSLHKP
jgi:SAM-dependent methyltransferase